MPIIQVNLLEGRTTAQKRELARRITDAVVAALGSKPESVRLMIREMGQDNFWVGGMTVAERAAARSAKGPGVNGTRVVATGRRA